MRKMREVVEALRSERAEALLELQEFDYAMDAILRHLIALQWSFHELYAELVALGQAEGSPEGAALHALIDRAGRVSSNAEQIVAAFEQFHSAIGGWGVRATDATPGS